MKKTVRKSCCFIFVCSCVILFSMFSASAECEHSDDKIDLHFTELSVKEPDCIEEGYSLFLCNLCLKTYKGLYKPALGHDFKAEENNTNMVYNSDMHHSYYCVNGCGSYGTADGGIHGKEKCSMTLIFEEKSTCISTGKKIYMCTLCLHNSEEITPLSDHKYNKVRKLPTCTEYGYDLYTCSVCDKSYKNRQVQPIEHISDGGTIESAPTYTKEGVIKFSCRVCNFVIKRQTIPKLVKYEVKIIPEKVAGFKVKSFGVSSVKLIWNKSSEAVSYKIYYSPDKETWKSVVTKNITVTIKNLKSSKKYYFKITALSDNAESAQSKAISSYTKPAQSVFVKAESKKKGICSLSWESLSRISGYEISYSTAKFSKKKNIKTLSVGKENKKTLKSLKSGKKYYFRVRAYKNVGGNKVYGAYSAVKTVKIK